MYLTTFDTRIFRPLSPPWEKIFKIEIFVLKYVLDHSKSIPMKKNFSKILRFFGDFFLFLGPKNRFFDFFGVEILKKKIRPFQQDCIAVILRYCMHLYAY